MNILLSIVLVMLYLSLLALPSYGMFLAIEDFMHGNRNMQSCAVMYFLLCLIGTLLFLAIGILILMGGSNG